MFWAGLGWAGCRTLGAMTEGMVMQGREVTAADVELIRAGHHRAGAHGKLARRQPRPVVHAEYGIHRKAFEQALLDHHPGATVGLFGGVKDKHHSTFEFAMPCQVFGRAQQHGHDPARHQEPGRRGCTAPNRSSATRTS